jgi:hypothetical protein
MSCLIVDDLLMTDEQGLVHGDLMQFYEDYRLSKIGANETPLLPRDWVIMTRSRVAIRRLESLLGAGFRGGRGDSVPILIDLTTRPRPDSLTPERLTDLLNLLRREDNLPKTWERLGRFDDVADTALEALRTERLANLGHLNILKGNLAEVFSMPQQLRVLNEIKATHPEAMIFSGARLRETGRSSRLFSDNIIARRLSNGNLQILMVFEVKSGYQGGAAGTEQVFEWTERRIEDGIRLEFPAGSRFYDIPMGGNPATDATIGRLDTALSYVYDPDRVTDSERVISLISSNRQIITATGQSQSGVDASLGIVGDRSVMELGVTSNDLDYLCAQLLLDRAGAL